MISEKEIDQTSENLAVALALCIKNGISEEKIHEIVKKVSQQFNNEENKIEMKGCIHFDNGYVFRPSQMSGSISGMSAFQAD